MIIETAPPPHTRFTSAGSGAPVNNLYTDYAQPANPSARDWEQDEVGPGRWCRHGWWAWSGGWGLGWVVWVDCAACGCGRHLTAAHLLACFTGLSHPGALSRVSGVDLGARLRRLLAPLRADHSRVGVPQRPDRRRRRHHHRLHRRHLWPGGSGCFPCVEQLGVAPRCADGSLQPPLNRFVAITLPLMPAYFYPHFTLLSCCITRHPWRPSCAGSTPQPLRESRARRGTN